MPNPSNRAKSYRRPTGGVADPVSAAEGHLDADCRLYRVETRILNQAVRRNMDRFLGNFNIPASVRKRDL